MLTMEVDAIILNAVQVIRRFLPGSEWKILLYGSRAKGSARPGSDIDIGILGPSEIPWGTMVKIYQGIDEIRTLRTIDVVDLLAAGEKFRSSVLATSLPLDS
ncbi:MAG: nucleotidyltransferase domain-containing protein [Bacteroidota bacterium]